MPKPDSIKELIGPNSVSPSPRSLSLEICFYSAAPMSNVVEVTPCCLETVGTSAIIGLLLLYDNGNRSSVGEVRLDLLRDPVQVDRSEKMILEFSSQKGYPYVSNIRSSHVNSGPFSGLDVSWTGHLEWWFSSRQCKIRHKGRESLITKF
ncbi:hypothetical protein GGR52DRAFT_546135 [Hypoxylon sp. FL1284]|nr:hypothetical protein GGR52DRAFT_546135 [Hypoxylon sp. FL1284]